MKFNQDHYQPTNREKKRQPKLGKTWCGSCDGCLVGDGEKCLRCGKTNKTNKAPRRDYK